MRVHLADMRLQPSPYNAAADIVDARAGVVRLKEPRGKVAIVGAGMGRDYAPFDDPEWEVWSLNAVASTDRFGRLRADRWFEMHVREAQNDKDMAWVGKCPTPIYLPPDWADRELRRSDREAPNAVRYPLEAVEKAFGSYFACSFGYMIGLALLEGFATIGLYGCELCFGTERERSVEWANVSWWMGYAEGRGVKVCLPPASHLGRHAYRYGVEYYEEKRDVDKYVSMMRQVDIERGIDKTQAYDSAKETWIGKAE